MVPVLVGGEWDSTMSVEGHQNQDNEDNQAFMNGLSADYWKTMGVPLVAGRDFDDRDAGKKIAVAIVNRKFATHFFGDKSPLGRHVGFGDGPKTVSYTHLRAHETGRNLVCRLLLEKKK